MELRDRIVTVFGGTGFLGQRVVRHLSGQGFPLRIASRHPGRAGAFENSAPRSIRANIHDGHAVAAAVAGAYAVVNAVSLYRERGAETFHTVHVEAAGRLARQAGRAGVARFVQISGIGADPASRSLYIRKRGEGELEVQAAFADAIIVRPAVMFGPDDAFLTTLVKLLKRLPAYPLFGRGLTRLQPAFVEDVAEAIARAIEPSAAHPIMYWRPAHLYIQRASHGSCGPAWEAAGLAACAICAMACPGTDRRAAAGRATKPQPGRPHGSGYGRFTGDAGFRRPWH